MIGDIPDVLAGSEHAAAHFIAVGIHYSQTVSGSLIVSAFSAEGQIVGHVGCG
jgi:hypothetical protein